jgi:ppGpp synthetase/RelA/SpoT-type nucleotidyltranferase
VSYRAKRPDRLKARVSQRHRDKNYQKVEEIYDDIIDLAGVRIALYFPGDLDEVERLLRNAFDVSNSKVFPDEGDQPAYKKRFCGYAARHYHIRIRSSDLKDTDSRYADAVVEVQVASVLMHAWSEVEHDLVYKPLGGNLSDEEYAILDELNGLVLAGEIALERLQRAGDLRLRLEEGAFHNHYELASYIYGKVSNES